MKCFRCGEPGTNLTTYDVCVGFFPIGGEPATCDACKEAIGEMSDADRAAAYVDFETTREAPSGSRDPIADILAREHEIKNRAKS